MDDVCVKKRYRASGAVYEYRFEIARVEGKRKWKTKSGFKTITDARQAGRLALRLYENYGHIVKDQISVADFLEAWLVHDCMVDLKPNIVVFPTPGSPEIKTIKPSGISICFLDITFILCAAS